MYQHFYLCVCVSVSVSVCVCVYIYVWHHAAGVDFYCILRILLYFTMGLCTSHFPASQLSSPNVKHLPKCVIC